MTYIYEYASSLFVFYTMYIVYYSHTVELKHNITVHLDYEKHKYTNVNIYNMH